MTTYENGIKKISLRTYYFYSVMLPLLIGIFGTIAFSIVVIENYESEWLTPASDVYMSAIFAISYAGILSILCLPIFLLKIDLIKKNTFLKLLSWFLLPISFITTIAIHENIFHEVNVENNQEPIWLFLVMNLPIIIALILGYVIFNNKSKITNNI